jgi:excinuclease UvrABC ATPase subunit
MSKATRTDTKAPALHVADRHDLIRVHGGHDGGRIVFEGTPAYLVAARSTLTGAHLAAYVGT